jgi:DNA-binding MarR family transcriptional regulator
MSARKRRTVPETVDVANAVLVSVSLLIRRLRQAPIANDLSLPERGVLSRLDRLGPMTAAALARLEQISPQSVGATVSALEAHGFVDRRRDPDDGRGVLLSVSRAGATVLRDRRAARVEQIARALSDDFTAQELADLAAATPLLERLAQLL